MRLFMVPADEPQPTEFKTKEGSKQTIATYEWEKAGDEPAKEAKAVADTSADSAYVRFLPSKEQIEAARKAKKKVFIAGTTVAGELPKNWIHDHRQFVIHRLRNALRHLEGVKTSELSKLHGELIAFGWADQNTGQVPCCYRVTASGLRAIQQVNGGVDDDGEVLNVPEKSFPSFAKKKREKAEPVVEAS